MSGTIDRITGNAKKDPHRRFMLPSVPEAAFSDTLFFGVEKTRIS